MTNLIEIERVLHCTLAEYRKIKKQLIYNAEIIIVDDELLGAVIIKNRYGSTTKISEKDYERIMFARII